MTELIMNENAGSAAAEALQVAEVVWYDADYGAQLKFPGASAHTTKGYKPVAGLSIADGDRVLVSKISGTYVIIAKLG